ncbi:hypothetical protein [Microbacterium terricola]|uniref:Lipoprotein n=1 Tax=Microbacterium terricola TaxID=344163 RepID=A0ABM8DUW4_9MICO|nr:hypothetical protein [Microbacterium terricola]UYK39879.1 hypothetical protein OAU46_14460 [Microbacterium terricola]BDV29365.1 hypothetical protein Microterr_00250 [Microbacterium terricola]
MAPVKKPAAALATSLLALVLAGCATPAIDVVAPSANATAAELGAAFAECGPNDELSVSVEDFLANTDAWYEVESIEGERVLDERNLVTITDTEGRTVQAGMFGERWPGIEWGQQTGSHIWVATSAEPEGLVQVVMVITPSGAAFFPGGCLDAYRANLHERNGDRTNELLAGLPFVKQSEVAAYLGVQAEPDPVKSPPTVRRSP